MAKIFCRDFFCFFCKRWKGLENYGIQGLTRPNAQGWNRRRYAQRGKGGVAREWELRHAMAGGLDDHLAHHKGQYNGPAEMA